MTSADPLAHERFRTIISDVLGNLDAEEEYENATESVVATFPEAHFEYRTNEAGVRLRKVVVEGEWEVDPLPAWMDGSSRSPDDANYVTRADGECVSTKSCVHTPHRAAPWHA